MVCVLVPLDDWLCKAHREEVLIPRCPCCVVQNQPPLLPRHSIGQVQGYHYEVSYQLAAVLTGW